MSALYCLRYVHMSECERECAEYATEPLQRQQQQNIQIDGVRNGVVMICDRAIWARAREHACVQDMVGHTRPEHTRARDSDNHFVRVSVFVFETVFMLGSYLRSVKRMRPRTRSRGQNLIFIRIYGLRHTHTNSPLALCDLLCGAACEKMRDSDKPAPHKRIINCPRPRPGGDQILTYKKVEKIICCILLIYIA